MLSYYYNLLNMRLAKLSFSSGVRVDFYHSLLLLLRNQVRLNKALEELVVVYTNGGKTPNNPVAIVISDLLRQMQEGTSFSESLKVWVPPAESILLVAGEMSGKLDVAFESAEMLIHSNGRIIGAITGAVAYPVFLFGLTGYLLHMIATNLVPKLAEVVDPNEWEGTAAILYHLSNFVSNYGLYTVLGIISAVLCALLSFSGLRGRIRIWLDKIPPWSVYRIVQGSTFLLNVAALIRSGVQLNTALEELGKGASPWLKERIDATRDQLAEGKNLGEALSDTGYGFPDPKANRFLSVIASYRGIEDAMDRFGRDWLEDTVKSIESMANIMLMVGVACVGLVMILVIAGAGGLQDAVQTSVGA